MRRKSKKRAFITSMVMLLVSAIVLTSSTFAWFVMGDKGVIEEMDVKLYASEGFQISANATDPSWRQNLTLDNLFNTDASTSDATYDAYAGNRNMLPEYLIPASSSFNNFGDYGYPNFYCLKVDAEGAVDASKIIEASGSADEAGIVAFDVFFKSGAAQKIDFSSTEVKEIGEESQNVLSCIRYAFVPMGTVEEGTEAATIQQLSNASAAKVVITEADSKGHSVEGAKNPSQATVPVNSTEVGTADTDMYIVKSGTALPTGTVYTSDAANKTFELGAGITKVRVYIWAEGNDVDCRDSISSSELSVAFKFTVAD